MLLHIFMIRELYIEIWNQVNNNLIFIIYIENILIMDKSDLESVKIADFGLSAKYKISQGGMYN
jgi:serine/threonine protein kinase